MRLEFDPAGEDFILIEQGRVCGRIFIPSEPTVENALEALALIARLRTRRATAQRPSITAPPLKLYEESQVRKFLPGSSKLNITLDDLEIDFEDLNDE